MGRMGLVDEFVESLATAITADAIGEALARATREMGFNRFALSYHIDLDGENNSVFRSHNYPPEWEDAYDRGALGGLDPVRRASERMVSGFAWSSIPTIIKMTSADREMLAAGQRYGIGDGFTVPANIPGELAGSCSFAMVPDLAVPAHHLGTAQLIGTFAFEAARRLREIAPKPGAAPLTDRQRDCVLWIARGKSDWEISRILGISQETVIQHVKFARERYDVEKRTALVVRALFDGLFSFTDILDRSR